MSDIFISYANEDAGRAKVLAGSLEAQGWSVWWDPDIPAGSTFRDDVIEEALDQAKCVVVMWSRHSVGSRWVKTEAAEGAKRGILVPVLIEDVQIPLAFRRIQAENLINWDGTPTSQVFQKLLADIANVLSREPVSGKPKTWLWAVAGVFVLVAGGLWYAQDPHQKQVEAEALRQVAPDPSAAIEALNEQRIVIQKSDDRQGNTVIFPRNTSNTILAEAVPLLRAVRTISGLNVNRTQVSDLAPLAKLTGLQTLDLSSTDVSGLAPVSKLTGLQTLVLSNTPVSDLAPVSKLTGLQTLNLGRTQVSDLAPLAKLTRLQTLVLTSTPVSDLAPLAKLTGLQTLV
ncbi:MAG: TIR domain-containing protein, partial [Gammaproteobacteria bacterium]|nr:TIR domain-containing protein [Gammaproteobacteria bacterium]